MPTRIALGHEAGLERAASTPGMRVRFDDGSVVVGIDAVRSIMVRTPVGIVGGVLLYLPGIHGLGRIGYDWFAGNRHRFGGSHACALPRDTGE